MLVATTIVFLNLLVYKRTSFTNAQKTARKTSAKLNHFGERYEKYAPLLQNDKDGEMIGWPKPAWLKQIQVGFKCAHVLQSTHAELFDFVGTRDNDVVLVDCGEVAVFLRLALKLRTHLQRGDGTRLWECLVPLYERTLRCIEQQRKRQKRRMQCGVG